MMKTLALSAIRFYQRHLSPYKGFCCAYCAYTGRASCSAFGARAIRRYGVWDGLGVLRGRLRKCGVAYRRYRPPPLPPRHRAVNRQAGFCDLSCDLPCDSSLPSAGNICGWLADCGADGCVDLWKDKRKRKEEDRVHLPPMVE